MIWYDIYSADNINDNNNDAQVKKQYFNQKSSIHFIIIIIIDRINPINNYFVCWVYWNLFSFKIW